MHDSSAAQIQRHMACIADDVACLSSFIGNLASCTSHSSRVSRQAVSVLPVHCPDKSGAVRTVCQARSARYIRVSDELAGFRRFVDPLAGGTVFKPPEELPELLPEEEELSELLERLELLSEAPESLLFAAFSFASASAFAFSSAAFFAASRRYRGNTRP